MSSITVTRAPTLAREFNCNQACDHFTGMSPVFCLSFKARDLRKNLVVLSSRSNSETWWLNNEQMHRWKMKRARKWESYNTGYSQAVTHPSTKPARQGLRWFLSIALRIPTAHDFRVHVHNKRNFPQANLDSEINARFVLNGHGDLYFLLHNNSVHTILLNLKTKTKKFYRKEKRYKWKSAQNRYSVRQIMTAKITTLRTLYVHVVLNSVMFPQILYDIVLYARHFLPVKFFFPSITFVSYVSSYRKM